MIIDVCKLIGEATEYDKKIMLERKKPKSWLKSVSAFANCEGGALIFGISDDSELVGLEDAKKDSEIISEAIKSRMDPIPVVNLKFDEIEGKRLIILHVRAGNAILLCRR